ncbi:DsbA family protein [Oceanicella actignis]|uniref:DsbA family protein n=1 Tax=Oceanicella actignis TaxID=1189325 RepID=UPI0011E66D74|nr:DsbA family protein [Oceanicella actignis]TYO89171.1 DSBA-like thioredoxin domain-containing protein [Oceanicella actignis]
MSARGAPWLAALALALLAVWGWRQQARLEPPELLPLAQPEGFFAPRGLGGASLSVAMPRLDRAPPPPSGEALCAALRTGPRAAGPAGKDAVHVAYFTDYRCPWCRALGAALEKRAARGDIVLTYQEYPVLGEASRMAARAALAAWGLGAYAPMRARLHSSAFAPNRAYLRAVAPQMGLDAARLLAELDSPKVDAALRRAAAAARAFGFRGTPGLVIGAVVVQGGPSEAALDALIEAARRLPDPCAG